MKIILLNFKSDYFPALVANLRKYAMDNSHLLKIVDSLDALKNNSKDYDFILSLGYNHLYEAMPLLELKQKPLFIIDCHMLENIEQLGSHQVIIKNKKLFQNIFSTFRIKIFSCFPGFLYLYENIGIAAKNIIWFKFPLDLNLASQIKGTQIDQIDYVFSAGNHQRDFRTLIAAYLQSGIKEKLIIMADRRKYQVEFATLYPANIVFFDQHNFNDFLVYLQNAKVVVLPLNNADHICNGLTFLSHCLALAKPLIVTDNLTIKSYIKNGFNALVVKPGQVDDMSKKLNFLTNNHRLSAYLAKNAFATAKQMSFNIFFKKVFEEYQTFKD